MEPKGLLSYLLGFFLISATFPATARQRTNAGKVTGKPIKDITIHLKGATSSVITGADGNFATGLRQQTSPKTPRAGQHPDNLSRSNYTLP